MGVAVMEPLRGGHLVNVPADVRARLAAADPSRSPAAWALDYLWDKPEIGCVLSGMGSIAELEANCAAAASSRPGMLSAADHEALAEAKRLFGRYPTIACTGCNYCAGCPAGVAIPYNMQTYNQYVLSGDIKRAKWEYATTIPLNGATAAACTGCGACERICPQHLPISQWMPRIDALLRAGGESR